MLFMISQPMNGLTDEEITQKKLLIENQLNALGYQVANTFFSFNPPSDVLNRGVYLLGASIKAMSKCDGVFFCKGWEDAKGCRIEHEVAQAYGLQCMYE